jgi:PKD repeat protein
MMMGKKRIGVAVGAAALALGVAACQRVPLLAPTGSSITLIAGATTLPINGSTTITAQVLEAAGTPPHSGTHVSFTTTLGSITPGEAETDLSGRVSVLFQAGTVSGTATINALSGAASTTATTGTGTAATNGAIKIAIGGAAVKTIQLSATPSTVPDTGGTVTLTALVLDTDGNPLPGVPVTFTTDTGQLAATVVTSNQSGSAVTTLTTSHAANVTAAAGSLAPVTTKIGVAVGPSITIGTPTPTSPTAGQPVSFDIDPTPATGGAAVRSVVVDFGDGSGPQNAAANKSTVVHTYANPGNYTVRATATDVNGTQGTAQRQVSVASRPTLSPTIAATTTSPTPNTPVAFTLTTGTLPTGCSVVTMVVNWGDGQTTTFSGASTAAQHTYSQPGNYTASITETDTCGNTGSGSTSFTVAPRNPLTPTISASANATTNSAVTFTITATPSTGCAIDRVSVSFGDGQSQTFSGATTSVQHVYKDPGTYTATVFVSDTCGASGSGSTSFTVNPPAPQASFTASPNPAHVGQLVQFNATASTGDIVTYTFDYGDGAFDSSSSKTQTHTYTAPSPTGGYTVTLTVTDSQGRSNSATKSVVVNP